MFFIKVLAIVIFLILFINEVYHLINLHKRFALLFSIDVIIEDLNFLSFFNSSFAIMPDIYIFLYIVDLNFMNLIAFFIFPFICMLQV
jgi:hypothetical protein